METEDLERLNNRRFLLVDCSYEPRKLIRGTAGEILEGIRAEVRSFYPSWLESDPPFDAFDFPTRLPPQVDRRGSGNPHEIAWDAIDAEKRVQWIESRVGLNLADDEARLRAVLALMSREVELMPEPGFWNVPDRCGWIEREILMVGPRPNTRAGSVSDTTLRALLDFGATSFVDLTVRENDQLVISAARTNTPVSPRLFTAQDESSIDGALSLISTLVRAHEVVYISPGRAYESFLELLLDYLRLRNLTHGEALGRVFSHVPRDLFLPG